MTEGKKVLLSWPSQVCISGVCHVHMVTVICFQHPQIQKESQYIKYLCCDDELTMTLWVTGIRIAKYGKQLYENYKAAVRKAAGTGSWANRTIQASSSASTPSPTPKAKAANGHAPQLPKDTKGPGNQTSFPPPPPSMETLPPPPPDPMLPPPPPAPPASTTKVNKFPPPTRFPQSSFPPPPMDDLPPPPPPPEDAELPPDFLPPPPPSFPPYGGDSLPPPPPDPKTLHLQVELHHLHPHPRLHHQLLHRQPNHPPAPSEKCLQLHQRELHLYKQRPQVANSCQN
ncbi:hypothetical protein PO909_016810 [Leuciscus waleckii]